MTNSSVALTSWINRFAAIVLLVAVYAAGFDTGRQQTLDNHPAAHQGMKP